MSDLYCMSTLGAVRAALKGDYVSMAGFLASCGVPAALVKETVEAAQSAESFRDDLAAAAREGARAEGYLAGRNDGYHEGYEVFS